ncbi:threonine ammonia-lyase [Selenihalanaerobacter shriftii]|uniref:L-threonine dehydratase catabolic TdcB n=1 Tax=Selenihalanaerobacter shriftii TaxID=142842 RepID=A0A1T4R7I9_9FIRM|nr:threonine ammonia-lyase [Selenihalanaerobacter shriftii]SKA11899.1 threonine dehydratase [Selenihalanaerobacter shriftii]
MELVTLQDIKNARHNLDGIIEETELDYSRTFSKLSGNEIYLKPENLQRTGSFKIRGAYNKIVNLTAKEKEKGVVAASAGNHAQGVALGATKAEIDSTIIMPKGAPIAKVKATQDYGAKVILSGNTYDEAHEKEEEYAEETGATIIPAFNDLDVIAGQGTIGLEILEELPDVEVIIAPIGGGGLLSGIATAVKETKPNVEIIGVEAVQAASMKASLRRGEVKTLTTVDTIADGIAVKRPGDLTYKIISKYVDHIVTVSEEEIAHAISLLSERSKLIVEGAGATGLAAVLNDKILLHGKKVAIVLSGGNIDLDMISTIIDRGMVKAGRRTVLTTRLPDTPGVLKKLLSVIAKTEANVISVHHDRLNPDISLKQAEVELALETKDSEHIEKIINKLKESGYDLKRLR